MPQVPKRLGRPPQWPEKALMRFPENTFARIALVLTGDEDRTAFVRAAVERELERREAPRAGAAQS